MKGILVDHPSVFVEHTQAAICRDQISHAGMTRHHRAGSSPADAKLAPGSRSQSTRHMEYGLAVNLVLALSWL